MEVKMAKTIKQIADELQVSKTAVSKKIENLGLRSSLRLNGNQFAINEEQENLIKSAFAQNNQGKSQTKTQTKSETKSQTKFAVGEEAKELIEFLKEQLKEKDKQIEKLQTAVDQAQQLQAMAETKTKLLEQQNDEFSNMKPRQFRKWWKKNK